MARTKKITKDIYEKIEDKKLEIQKAEDEVKRLNEELKVLFDEQDKEEMEKMLQSIRSQGIDIETALKKLAASK